MVCSGAWKSHQYNAVFYSSNTSSFNPSTNSSFRFNYSVQRCFLIQLLQPSSRRFQQTPPANPTHQSGVASCSAISPPCRARARVGARNRRTNRRHQTVAAGSGTRGCYIHASMDPVAVADPSPSRRSGKRRPPARSPELSPKAASGGDATEAEELIRRVEELEAAAARLRGEKDAAEEAARALQQELDAERSSAETATSEAMLMIERLQREKAAAQMEARQFRRYADGRADRELEVQEELASLSDLAASYYSRLRSHGIDPDSFSDEDEEELDVEEGEEVEQIDVSDLAAVRNAGDASTGMEVKAMVVDDDYKEEPLSPVEKEFEYMVDVPCTTKAVGAVVTEYVGDGNAGGLYARVEALEADRVALRRELAALRAERAQLAMAREMARRLCWEMVAEQRAIVKKTTAPAGSFSMFGICKWVLSILFWRNRSSTAKYTFSLSTSFLGLLLLLHRSTIFSPWRRLPRPQR